MKKYRRVQADIDLDAVLFNFDQMSKNVPEGTRIMAVVKTDAYGHGAVPLARLLEPQTYLWGFATATVDEAVELRQAGIKKPILVSKGTYLAEIVTQYRLGLAVDVETEDTVRAVRSYLETFDPIAFEEGCRQFLDRVEQEIKVYNHALQNFCRQD